MDLKLNHIAPILTEPTSVNQPCSSSEPLDDVCSTSWLDAMKSSSPRNNIIKNNDSELAKELAYRDWMVEYPSALASIEQIVTDAKGKKLALFLDYDGTLSPIVDNPDLAFMSDVMRDAVRNVAKYIPTAIVSGRSRAKVYNFVGLKELHYAGSHGMDICGPVQSPSDQKTGKSLYKPATELLPTIQKAFVSLVEIMKDIEGANVEDNMFSVSVHYRNVDEKNWKTVAQYVKDTLKNYPRLRLTHGRMVLEVRPVLDWDKGKAVKFLLESLGLSNRDDVLPIYIGDDKTDEDAFKYLSEECGRGYGILVTPAPRETSAYYSLRDTSEVMEFINFLASSVA